MKWIAQLLPKVVPAYYHLGMWRVQYIQKVCCVCHINPAVTIPAVTVKECLQSRHSFFSCLLCQACHDDINWLPPVFEQTLPFIDQSGQKAVLLRAQSAAPHLDFIRDAVIAFKYREQLKALPIIVHAIHQLPRPRGCHAKNSVILATPTTDSRLAKRGFDPVAIVARYLASHWQIPLWKGVSRVDEVISQQGLDRYERQQNIVNAFVVNTAPPCKRVILFDDVVTTGATLSALAVTLLKAYPVTTICAYSITHGK